jgi:hypothetical protein
VYDLIDRYSYGSVTEHMQVDRYCVKVVCVISGRYLFILTVQLIVARLRSSINVGHFLAYNKYSRSAGIGFRYLRLGRRLRFLSSLALGAAKAIDLVNCLTTRPADILS